MTTLNQAIEILKNGNESLAWETARKDSGLNEGVEKADWLKFAHNVIERRVNEKKLFSGCHVG